MIRKILLGLCMLLALALSITVWVWAETQPSSVQWSLTLGSFALVVLGWLITACGKACKPMPTKPKGTKSPNSSGGCGKSADTPCG